MKTRLLVWSVVIALALAALWYFRPSAPVNDARPRGGDFTLQSADGPVALADLRGQVVLLFFGYTYCPDICPTSLAATAAGLRQLRPEELSRVQALFVSVDPPRDTPARLKEYTAFFHPGIRGLTGSPAAVADVAARYGAVYQRQGDSPSSYVIDHTAITYVIGPDGVLRDEIPHAAPPDQVAAAIRRWLPR